MRIQPIKYTAPNIPSSTNNMAFALMGFPCGGCKVWTGRNSATKSLDRASQSTTALPQDDPSALPYHSNLHRRHESPGRSTEHVQAEIARSGGRVLEVVGLADP